MRGRHRGLTLVELLAVVAIVAILAAAVFPSFQQIYLKIRLEGVANELRTDLQYARSESIRLQSQVSVTSTANGTGYSLTDASANVLKSVTFPTGTTVDVTTNGVPLIVFNPLRGFASTPAGKSPKFTLATTNLSASLALSASAVGQVSACVSSGSFYGVTNAC